jgi:hypothetical protein
MTATIANKLILLIVFHNRTAHLKVVQTLVKRGQHWKGKQNSKTLIMQFWWHFECLNLSEMFKDIFLFMKIKVLLQNDSSTILNFYTFPVVPSTINISMQKRGGFIKQLRKSHDWMYFSIQRKRRKNFKIWQRIKNVFSLCKYFAISAKIKEEKENLLI